MSTPNKEEIYDAQINPLMAQIIAICKEHKIAMLATFAIPTEKDPELYCTTATVDEADDQPENMKKCLRALGVGSPTLTMLKAEHADGGVTMTAILG